MNNSKLLILKYSENFSFKMRPFSSKSDKKKLHSDYKINLESTNIMCVKQYESYSVLVMMSSNRRHKLRHNTRLSTFID